MLVIAHGPDNALARSLAAAFLREHDPDDLSTSHFDAQETSLGDIVAAASSVGFFGIRRIVAVRDLLAKAGHGKATAGDAEAPAAKAKVHFDLTPLFAAATGENIVLLIEPTLASVPAAIRKIAPPNMVVLPGEPPRGRDLIDWLQRAAVVAGNEMTPAAAKQLAELLYPQTWNAKPSNPRYDRPPDTATLQRQVEVLAMYAHPSRIEPKHVHDLVNGGQDDKIFAFLEAASSGNLPNAVKQLEQLLLAGEEPAKLAAQLHGQLELGLLATHGQNLDAAGIGREIGLANPNQMVAIARSRRGMHPDVADRQTESALAADRGVKTGRLRHPLDAITALLADLANTATPVQRN